MNTTSKQRRSGLSAAALAAGALLLAGCADAGGGVVDENRPEGAGVAAVADDLQRWLEGTSVEPDTSDSPEPAADKEVMLISCGQSTSSCARGIQGAEEAAEAIGWKSTVYDTKGNLSAAGDGIRQAIASGIDGIFIYFIDCSYMQQPLEEAKAAGIPVVQAEGVDCDVADPAAPSLFSYSVEYVEGDLLTWIEDFGAGSAAYLIDQTRGYADTLFVADNAAIGTEHVIAGFDRMMERCPDCTAEVLEYSFDKLYGEGVSQDLQQQLLKRPDVNSVGVAYDAILLSGVADAVQQASKSGQDYLLTGGEGSEAAMDYLRSGLVVAGVGLDNEWEGWSGIDNLNRLFQGAPTANSGIGIEIYDAERNTPESGPFVSKIDYESVYREAWGR
ncbi:sugar ABC transporter substrate-binding protein [Leucobacter sp.]